MKLQRIALLCALAAAMGTAAGTHAAQSQVQPSQQCYHREPLDAPDACTWCGNRCMGSGYKCCTIIAY
jgi:hypothetical protein